MGRRDKGDYDTLLSRRVNKNFGKRNRYRYVTYVTIRDNTCRSSRLLYRTFELIVKRYSARYYGVRVKTRRSTHIHAILVSERYVDRRVVKSEIQPDGINVDVRSLNGKTLDDLRRVVRYIESKKNEGRKLGSRYVVCLARRVLDPFWKR